MAFIYPAGRFTFPVPRFETVYLRPWIHAVRGGTFAASTQNGAKLGQLIRDFRMIGS